MEQEQKQKQQMLAERFNLSLLFQGKMNPKDIELIKSCYFVRVFIGSELVTQIIDIYPLYYNFYDVKVEKIKVTYNIQKLFESKEFSLITTQIQDLLGLNAPSSDYHECSPVEHRCRECNKYVTLVYAQNDKDSNILMLLSDNNMYIQIIVNKSTYDDVKKFVNLLYNKL